MKTKLLLISTITILSLLNCQEKKVTNPTPNTNKNMSENTMNSSEIKRILIKQIKSGPDSEYWEEADSYTKEDLDALISIEDTILKNNGYKTPGQEAFNEKIRNIFSRIIDNQSGNSYLKVDRHDKCDRELSYEPFNTGEDDIYVDKNHRFITIFYSLPQIIDYQKVYPEVSKYEKKPFTTIDIDGTKREISRWKDLESLPYYRRLYRQSILSQNKYLFNDDKSQFAWLTTNDENFMESLVTIFGYTKDKKLLKWVMDKNYNNAEDFVKNYVFVKNCQGKLEIRQDILKYIEETTNENENIYHRALESFERDALDNTYFDKQDRIKIIAYIANTVNPLFYKYNYIDGKAIWKAGTVFYNLSVEHENLIPEIEKNHYYNLPNLKKIIKEGLVNEAPRSADPD